MVSGEAHYVFCCRILFDITIPETMLRNLVFKKDPDKCSSVIFCWSLRCMHGQRCISEVLPRWELPPWEARCLECQTWEIKEKIAKGFESTVGFAPSWSSVRRNRNGGKSQGSRRYHHLLDGAACATVIGAKLIGSLDCYTQGVLIHCVSGF